MFEGLIDLPWWGYVLAALAITHVTIISVTLYLHRNQTHLALDLHPVVGHFFRFWLWLTTGMVTREWVAVHRKHHAKVETAEDPHSPQVRGIHTVLWLGAWLYRKESNIQETLEKYGYGTPNDWVERNIYTPLTYVGPAFMLLINIVLFGLYPGFAIWVVQMLWIPFWAAGVINGVGHFFGYRNYEVADASKNIVPWGIIIGGEELHNNHHAHASSARFSSRRWEIDLGWFYIRVLKLVKLARVKKLAPQLLIQPDKGHCDFDTLRAVLNSRFQVMANFVKDALRPVYREEVRKARKEDRARWTLLKRAKMLMIREGSQLDETHRTSLNKALELNPKLKTVYAMKQGLQEIWGRSTTTQEHLLHALEEWCHEAEASGIEALRDFSLKLRGYTLARSGP
ncbi:MAG: transposase [Gammaproteobacteria bacterium]|nr:transposase [Gammaproteobacteria bacterium]